jgi:hypothetical protein
VQGEPQGVCAPSGTLISFTMESSFESTHWIMVQICSSTLGMMIHFLNVYMPNNYWEKMNVGYLLEIKELRVWTKLYNCRGF